MNNAAFFALLFDPGESTNVGPEIWVTSVYPLDNVPAYLGKALFCINPLDPTKTRSDAAVTIYRNILIECDDLTLLEQRQLIIESNLPYSTIVFSGNRSLHIIISLLEPCATRDEWGSLVSRIHKALGGKGIVDTANKNPSRTSHYPGSIRNDTGKVKTLLAVKSRISKADLEEWLISKGVPSEQPIVRQTTPHFFDSPKGYLRGSTLNFLMGIYDHGTWNVSLFKAACNLFEAGYSEEEVEDKLGSISGHLDKKDMSTIRSAAKRVL